MEIGNGYSELNDPLDQRARFEESAAAHAAGDEETQPMDEDYLRRWSTGCRRPAASGWASTGC